MEFGLNDESLVKARKAMLIAPRAVCTRMQRKWFAERSIAPHIFSCQYVDKSSWQDERKVFREDEGTISVVLDEQKPLGFAAELAGVGRLCLFFFFPPKTLSQKRTRRKRESQVIAIILRKHNLHLCIFQIFSNVSLLIPDSSNINSDNFVDCHGIVFADMMLLQCNIISLIIWYILV